MVESEIEIALADPVAKDGVDGADGEVTIAVQTGFKEERAVKLRFGRPVVEILEIVAVERGGRVEELVLVADGEAEPVSVDILIDSNYPHHRRHHVHHTGSVDVIIYYGSGHHHREFRRHATVGDALAWAIKVFNIDATMASEFDLTRHGQKDALPDSEHIGHLAGHHKTLELDLVRGDIANGSDFP